MNLGKSNYLKYLFLVLILADIGYTYIQNSNSMMLDGDMPAIIIPSDAYKKVLADPFGMSIIFNDEYYPASNRFFMHFFMQKYFQIMPEFVQKFVDPVESIFICNALARTVMHTLLLYLIGVVISGRKYIGDSKLLLAMLFITPLFQTNGYSGTFGLTTDSITYTFFYSLPIIFILIYFIPFVQNIFHGKPLFNKGYKDIILFVLAFFIAFGGPLSPAVVLIFVLLSSLVLYSNKFNEDKSPVNFPKIWNAYLAIPLRIKLHFAFISVLCLYSSYLGTHNSENYWIELDLLSRYKMLCIGFWNLITIKIGLPLLIVLCISGTYILKRIHGKESQKSLNFISILTIFSIIYLLLLPMGGYREYRPHILRFDTFSPVSMSLIIVFGILSLEFISYYRGRTRNILIGSFVLIAFVYMNADRIKWKENQCQKEQLYTLAESNDKVVAFNHWCKLLTWGEFLKPEESRLCGELIYSWNITNDKKLYYFQK